MVCILLINRLDVSIDIIDSRINELVIMMIDEVSLHRLTNEHTSKIDYTAYSHDL